MRGWRGDGIGLGLPVVGFRAAAFGVAEGRVEGCVRARQRDRESCEGLQVHGRWLVGLDNERLKLERNELRSEKLLAESVLSYLCTATVFGIALLLSLRWCLK